MKTKFGATVLSAAFLAALVIPWTVMAGGGGGGKGGGSGAGRMGGESIRNQIRIENQVRSRDMEHFRMRDGEGNREGVREQDRNRDRDRDRDQVHKVTGAEPAAAATGSAVSATGDKAKKGNAYGPGDGTGPYLPKDGTGYGAPANR